MRFKDFLIEKQVAKKPPKPKPRPNKNLWFTAPDYWQEDIKFTKGDNVSYYEDEEENIFVTDPDGEQCYGYWNKQKNGGMTFANPKPFRLYQNRKSMKEVK